MNYRYIIIGGNPMSMYNGTTTFTSLRVIGKTNDHNKAQEIADHNYDQCAGLIDIVDTNMFDWEEKVGT
jgi:hypothetical protein